MNKTAQSFKEWFERGRKRLNYYVQRAIVEFTEAIVVRMEHRSISKTDLATKLNCNPSYITKVLRGSTNFTLESMVKIALALECELVVGLRPKASAEPWGDFDFQTSRCANMERPVWVWNVRGNLTQFKSELTKGQRYESSRITVTTEPSGVY